MTDTISRRQLLKLGGAALLGLALPNVPRAQAGPLPPNSPGLRRWGRSVTTYLRVYAEPDFAAEQVAWYGFDDVFPLLADLEGPHLRFRSNTLWHQIPAGYVHSMYVQPVGYRLNPVVSAFPEEGLGWLGEITVPWSQAIWRADKPGYHAYRLYHSSVYWVAALVSGPEGSPLYQLYDERLGVYYYVPAQHVRIIPPEEVTPINPGAADKRVVIDLNVQQLWAYEGEAEVFSTAISSGRYRSAAAIAADAEGEGFRSLTPEGQFRIIRKKPSRHMGGGDRAGEYELPGVPWVAYFSSGGYATHGAFWHSDWGFPHSAGCINMIPDEAKWLFRWLEPEVPYGDELVDEVGTPVEIFGWRHTA